MRLAAFHFSPRCSYFHTVSLCLPPRCSPPLMCCRRAASRSALASVGCRRRLRSLAALHSRSELKHQKSAFRRSENCGRPRSRFNKDRTLSTSCHSLRNRRSYRMRQFGLGERSRVRVGARVGSAMVVHCQSSHSPRHSAALWRRACGSACRGGKGRSRSWSDCGHNSRHLLPYQNRATRSRRPTRGSVQAIVDDIGHFQERGLQHCVIGGDGKDLQGTLELLEQFASEVMAKCA
jgi:hypothetical protein